MRKSSTRNLAASVRQRLFNLSKKKGESFDLVLTRYALERLLYRISQSKYRKKFLLKGAMLFSIWFDAPHRLTRDLDLLGFGTGDITNLEQVFQSLCKVDVVEDGVAFPPETVRGDEIRDSTEYHGVRIHLMANLAGARIPLQIDVGFGDVVIPAPEEITYPTLLEFPAPKLRAYSKYSVVSEKFQAMVMLGIANSRMKDFFDIWAIAQKFDFDGFILSRAIQSTFKQRNTVLSGEIPLSLTDSFSEDRLKRIQWRAFIRKNRIDNAPEDLRDVIGVIANFLGPIVDDIVKGRSFNRIWRAPGHWVVHSAGGI